MTAVDLQSHRAAYAPPIGLPNMLLGACLGTALGLALWWAGHAGAAVAVAVLTAAATSLGSYLPLERVWVGDGWIANQQWRRTIVAEAHEVRTISLPYHDAGLSYLIFRTADRRSVVVDIDQLFRRPELARATLAVADQAFAAAIEPAARTILDRLRTRT